MHIITITHNIISDNTHARTRLLNFATVNTNTIMAHNIKLTIISSSTYTTTQRIAIGTTYSFITVRLLIIISHARLIVLLVVSVNRTRTRTLMYTRAL